MQKRILSMFLVVCMVFTLFPAVTFATESSAIGTINDVDSKTSAVCKNHKEHDKSCGYIKAIEGIPCGDLAEDGYFCGPIKDLDQASPSDADETDNNEETYICDHTDGCGYAEAVEGVPCAHECDLCSSGNEDLKENCSCGVLCTEDQGNPDCLVCNTADEALSVCKGSVSPAAIKEVTGFSELEEAVRYQRTDAGSLNLPESLKATVDGMEKEVPVTWKGRSEINSMGGGLYVLTAETKESYTLADGVAAPKITAMILGRGRDGGLGTAQNPLEISSEVLLREVSELVNDGQLETLVSGKAEAKVCFILTNDIILHGEWTPIGTQDSPFRGVFDGDGHTVTGLPNGAFMGVEDLFGSTAEGSEIKNLGPLKAQSQDVFKVESLSLDGTKEKVVDLSSEVQTFSSYNEGSVHVRFRLNNTSPSADAGLMSLFSMSNSNVENTYMVFYVNPVSGKVGYELRNNSTTINSVSGSAEVKDKNWHTISYVFSLTSGKQQIYLDGELIQESNKPNFLSSVTDQPNTVRIGNLSRLNKGDHTWVFQGDIDFLEISGIPSDEEEVKEIHQATIDHRTTAEEPADSVKTKTIDLFKAGYENSNSYRIPSLLTVSDGADSVVIAAIDKRNKDASDWYDIDTVIRRSFDNGNTWDSIQTLVDLPSKDNLDASFTIDASMVQDADTGRIFLLVDMFPESYALVSSHLLETGTGWKKVNGKNYFILRNYPEIKDTGTSLGNYTTEYLLDTSDGKVYLASDNSVTAYTVPNFHTGELLKNGVSAGNIFMYSKGGNPGEITAVRTSYLWMMSSDDLGATWTDPVDITGQVKKDWMLFIGTGPGVGMQIKHGQHAGRLVFPIYHSNKNLGGSQASAVIYSDDNGVTWELGKSPMILEGLDPETMNNSSKLLTENQVVEVGSKGVLKMFCRNRSGKVKVATSKDGGETWVSLQQDSQLIDPYCQLSIIPYSQLVDNKQAFIFSNPADTSRNNGTVRLGLYDETTDTFNWKYKRLLHPGAFQYSSLTELPDKTIGILYEGDVPNMKFTSFNDRWIIAGDPIGLTKKPSITNITMEQSDDLLTFTVDFDQYLIKTGHPQLKFTLAGKEKAASYASGNGSKTFTFTYTLSDKESGNVIAVNVKAPDGSTIGNRNNELPVDVSYPFKAKQFPEDTTGDGSTGDDSTGDDSTEDGSANDRDSSSDDSDTNTAAAIPPAAKPVIPTQGEIKVTANLDENGNAAIHITNQNVTDALEKALADAKKSGNTASGITLIFNVDTGGTTVNSVMVNLLKTVQDTIIGKQIVNTIVVIDNPDIKIDMDLNTIKEINRQAQSDVNITAIRKSNGTLTGNAKTAIGSRPVFDLTVTGGDGKEVQNFGEGSVSVTMPYTLGANEKAGNVQAVYVDGSDKVQWLTSSVYDKTKKVMSFSTNHFSTYGVGYRDDVPAFTDISGHWAKDDIEFAVNRGLLSGTGAAAFSPDSAMTRGMLVTALGRLASADVSGYKQSSFSDVAADSYQLGYIEWAVKNGIVNGDTDGRFNPDASVTREQTAAILSDYAKAIGFTTPKVHELNTFEDSVKISAYAIGAVKQMQMAGVLAGKKGNMFDPQGTATRAEVSAMLRRFAELTISSDTMQGWTMNDSGQWRYYENGRPATGTKNIDGTAYTFDKYGLMP